MQYNNPDLVAAVTPLASGAIYIDRQVTLFSDSKAWPAAIAAGDQVQIGVIPAGMVLVPQLSSLQVPQFDTNGAPTGSFTIGAAGVSNNIKSAATTGGAASTTEVGTLSIAAALGSPTDDTPIYANFSAAVATMTTVGQITADWAFRPFRSDVDTDDGV